MGQNQLGVKMYFKTEGGRLNVFASEANVRQLYWGGVSPVLRRRRFHLHFPCTDDHCCTVDCPIGTH